MNRRPLTTSANGEGNTWRTCTYAKKNTLSGTYGNLGKEEKETVNGWAQNAFSLPKRRRTETSSTALSWKRRETNDGSHRFCNLHLYDVICDLRRKIADAGDLWRRIADAGTLNLIMQSERVGLFLSMKTFEKNVERQGLPLKMLNWKCQIQ